MHKPVAKVDSGIEQDAPPKGKFSLHSKFSSNSPKIGGWFIANLQK